MGCGQVSIHDIFHPLSCPKFKGNYQNMHDEIRDLLCDFIKKVNPGALVKKEQKITQFRKADVPASQLLNNQVVI